MSQSVAREPGRAAWVRSPFVRQLGLIVLGLGVGLGVGGAVVAARNPVYVVAGLLGAALGLAMLASVRVGFLTFVGVVTLLPFAVIPVPLGTFKLTALDVTLTTLLLVFIARLLLRSEERLVVSGLEGFVALYIGLSVFSFLNGTGTTSETMRLFLKLINSVLLYFTVVNCVRTRREVEQIVVGLIGGAAASAALGIALYVIPRPTAARLLSALAPLGYPSGSNVLRYLPSTDTLRAISTSIDPNVFGVMLMLAVVLALSQILAPRPALDRRLLVGLLAVILVALLLSYSRGSWVGALAGVLVIVTLRYRRLWVIVALGVALAALAVLPSVGTLPGLGSFFAHLQSGFEARDQAAAMRLGEYKDAFRLISQYPWFGVGFGVAPDVDLYIGVSSIYLLLAEQIGLVGLAAYLLAVGAVLYRGLRPLLLDLPALRTIRIGRLQMGGPRAAPRAEAAPSVDPAVESLLLGTTAALIAALTAGVFDHHLVNLRFPHVVALFWLLAGLTVVGARLARPSAEPGQG